MEVLLFGGSFDPPHLGHRIVASQAREFLPEIDELWFLPAHSHTFGKDLSDDKHRMSMLELFVKDFDSSYFRICPVELDFSLSGETYATYQILRENRDYLLETMGIGIEENISFSFLMGTDQIERFDEWGHYEELLEQMKFYLYPRAGYPHKTVYRKMQLLTAPDQIVTNISSSLVRDRIRENKQTEYVINNRILTYIKDNRLY